MILQVTPIGYFSCRSSEKYMAPKQAELGLIQEGCITLLPNYNFEQALQDIVGFDRIWILYWFHQNHHHGNHNWKPKVQTPNKGPKRGLFATRSPHRPNPIGMSAVSLIKIQGREIIVGKNDLLDGTPILDIKPYLAYADAFPDSRSGWLEGVEESQEYEVHWSERAREQALFVAQMTAFDLKMSVETRLLNNPFPFPSHRIKKVGEDEYVLAVKSWRVVYRVVGERVEVEEVRSGYDRETMVGEKVSRWNDVGVHQAFVQQYYGEFRDCTQRRRDAKERRGSLQDK